MGRAFVVQILQSSACREVIAQQDRQVVAEQGVAVHTCFKLASGIKPVQFTLCDASEPRIQNHRVLREGVKDVNCLRAFSQPCQRASVAGVEIQKKTEQSRVIARWTSLRISMTNLVIECWKTSSIRPQF